MYYRRFEHLIILIELPIDALIAHLVFSVQDILCLTRSAAVSCCA